MTQLDLEFVRNQFPAFEQDNLQGWGFFENAGGSYCCTQVLERLCRYYRETKVQPYGGFPASKRAGEEMDQARARLAALVNVEVDEISFGPSTSQNTYVLAQAFRTLLKPGDEIIVTNQDHEANSGVWRRLERDGMVIREWRVDAQSGALDPGELDSLITPRTRLITMPHCSNIVAQFNDVAAAAAKAHQAGALLVADGVSYAPHGLPDIGALGVDVYLMSLYKTFGPHQGLLYVQGDLLQRLENQGHYFNAARSDKRLTPAGPDHAQISAANGIADYYEALYGHHFGAAAAGPSEQAGAVNALFRAHESRLTDKLLDFLRGREDLRILGPDTARARAATIALQTRTPPPELAAKLADHHIMAGAGHFYAVRLLEGLNVAPDPGVLRLSFVHYTSEDEIDRLIAALERVLQS